jgi:hypothetical protein
MIKLKNTVFFVIFAIFLTFFGCYKGYREVSQGEVLENNEGIIVFKIINPGVTLIGDLNIIIQGFDISKANVDKVSRIWIYAKSDTNNTYRYIVPAGRYRIENIKGISEDPGITRTSGHTAEIEYSPRFSFYVVKNKVNYLGVWSFNRTENKNIVGAMNMYSAQQGHGQWYQFLQVMDYNIIDKFKTDYPKLMKQTSGVRSQSIIFRPWNRVYGINDPLKSSPQFENGYGMIKWLHNIKIAKNLLENKYDIPKLEVINQTRFVDRTNANEVALYDFNTLNSVKYHLGGLYKVTIVRNEKFQAVLEKFKNLYGIYNKEDGKVIWRLVNNRITIEPFGDDKTRITLVSMEYIRKVAQFKPSAAGTFNPSEISGVTPRVSAPAPEASSTSQGAETN